MTNNTWADWVIDQTAKTNPYPLTDKNKLAELYAVGFLASYLAGILKNDRLAFEQFKQHCERQQQKTKKKQQ